MKKLIRVDIEVTEEGFKKMCGRWPISTLEARLLKSFVEPKYPDELWDLIPENYTAKVTTLDLEPSKRLITFLKHIQGPCPCVLKQRSCNYDTQYCELSICTTCGGGEGSLTSHCPGRRLSSKEQDEIMKGKDFYFGEWCESEKERETEMIILGYLGKGERK